MMKDRVEVFWDKYSQNGAALWTRPLNLEGSEPGHCIFFAGGGIKSPHQVSPTTSIGAVHVAVER
jgi:hypothetical protein